MLLHLQAEVPAEVREVLEVIPCKRLEEVLQDAFDPPLNLAQPIVLARL
jgi:ATP-dependent Lon protease